MSLTKVVVPLRAPGGTLRIIEAPPSDLDWPDLRRLWHQAGVSRPNCFAPPDEKLDVFFYYACRGAKLPTSLGTVFNPSWTDLFMKTLGHDCLVISAELLKYLTEKDLFARQIPNLKSVVVVGETSEDLTPTFQSLANRCTVHMLAHPAHALTP